MLVAMRWMFLVISMSSGEAFGVPPRQPLPSEQAVLGIDGSCPEFLVGRTGQPGDHHLRHVAGRTQNFPFPHRRFGVARHHFPKQEPKGRDTFTHAAHLLHLGGQCIQHAADTPEPGEQFFGERFGIPPQKRIAQQEFQYFIIGKRGAVFEKTLAA